MTIADYAPRCCLNLCGATALAIHWLSYQLKSLGAAAWRTLKATSVLALHFFTCLGQYVYFGALLIKGKISQGLSCVKHSFSQIPREVKIGFACGGIGMAVSAIATYLYLKHSDC